MDTNTDKRQKILTRVQALYAKAAATDFGPEADAFTSKADELMLEWAIAEAELAMDDPKLHQFSKRKFEFHGSLYSDTGSWQYQLLGIVAQHYGLIKTPDLESDGHYYVGTRSDLDHCELVYTNLLGHFMKTVAPKPDPDLPLAENLYSLRMAGLSWAKIDAMLPDHKLSTSWSKKVRDFADERGLDLNTGNQSRNYRDQFMQAYNHRLSQRFREMRNEQEETRKGAELVLFDKTSKLKEYLWDLYPDLRPHPEDCECESCHYRRCHDRKCPRTMCANMRKPMRRGRSYVRSVQYNPTAVRAGQRAANSADLGQKRVGGKRGELK